MTDLLELSGIRAGFGIKTVLRRCSYSVRAGEVAALVGLNGAGKSVSLAVASGVLDPWGGTVRFAGADVTRLRAEERVRAGIAHVLQGRHVFPGLSVDENLRLGAMTRRNRARTRYEEVRASALDRFPILRERHEQRAESLSSGEQAALAVARGLMSEPRLLILDEPSAGLDPHAVRDLFDALRDIKRTGTTVLLAEQNLSLTMEIADRIHVMEGGRVVETVDAGSVDRSRIASLLGFGGIVRD